MALPSGQEPGFSPTAGLDVFEKRKTLQILVYSVSICFISVLFYFALPISSRLLAIYLLVLKTGRSQRKPTAAKTGRNGHEMKEIKRQLW
jgi:hypothetical protein